MLPNSEWILLAIIGVILLKPEDIPIIAKFIARFVHQAQQILKELYSPYKIIPQKKHPFNGAPPKVKIPPAKD